MYFLLVKAVCAVIMLGQYLADGPMPPTLDFLLKLYGFKMVPAGIEHVPEEGDGVQVVSWICEWLALGNNLLLGGLICGLSFWAVIHWCDWIGSLGGGAISPVLKGDEEYKDKVLNHMKRAFSSRGYGPQDGQGFGKILEIRLRNRKGEYPQDSFYALQVSPSTMDEMKRNPIRRIASIRRVNVEILDDDQHHFLLFSGPREEVDSAHKNLRRKFDKKTNKI